jgi:hypothetical protein
MLMLMRSYPRATRVVTLATLAVLTSATLVACGGGESNPLDNPGAINNPVQVSGQRLSLAYFQKCINPIFDAPLPIRMGGITSTNSCAGAGCHDTVAGTGGAFRVAPLASALDLSDPANTPDFIRASAMYKNYYSAQGVVVAGFPDSSRLLAKPLLSNVLHGGGLVFETPSDPNAVLIHYWISHPAPLGQDEFGPNPSYLTLC